MLCKKGALQNIAFTAATVVFFFSTLILSQHKDIFVSPDETASAFFSEQFAQSGSFVVEDSVATMFSSALIPRSVTVVPGAIVPVSFLGLPLLYGLFVFIFGSWILMILTPLIAVLAVFAFKRVVSYLFSERVALLSAVFLMFHPAFWYYTARHMMHNVLFVSLLIFALWFFLHRPLARHLESCVNRFGKLKNYQKHIDPFLSGLCVSLALFVRTSEALWIAFGLALAVIWFYKKLSGSDIARFVVGLGVGITLFFWSNFATYGSPFTTGYALQNVQSIEESSTVLEQANTYSLFPFGINERVALNHFDDYAVKLFWWLSILTIIGAILAVQKINNNNLTARRFYVFLFLCVNAWLGLWYGSWTFFDNPDTSQISIANSYVRYWLPIFVMSTPLIALCVDWLGKRAKGVFAERLFVATLVLLILGANINSVFFNGQDGLVNVSETLAASKQIRSDVLERTPENSVFIVDRSDKLFFPFRHVRYPLRTQETYALMPDIVKLYPLYYYGITLPLEDLLYLNERKLKEHKLSIEHIATYQQESLYRIFSQ